MVQKTTSEPIMDLVRSCHAVDYVEKVFLLPLFLGKKHAQSQGISIKLRKCGYVIEKLNSYSYTQHLLFMTFSAEPVSDAYFHVSTRRPLT